MGRDDTGLDDFTFRRLPESSPGGGPIGLLPETPRKAGILKFATPVEEDGVPIR